MEPIIYNGPANSNHRLAIIDSEILSDICYLLRSGRDDLKGSAASILTAMTLLSYFNNDGGFELAYLLRTVLKPFANFFKFG